MASPLTIAALQSGEEIARPSEMSSPRMSTSAASDFGEAMGAAQAGRPLRPVVVHQAEEVAPEQQFEAFALRSFVESMLPDADSFFGSGTAGSIWRSMLAEHLGAKLAEDGGIGIADAIRSKNGDDQDPSRVIDAPRNAPLSETLAALSLNMKSPE